MNPYCEARDEDYYCQLFEPEPDRPAVGSTEYFRLAIAFNELVDTMVDDGSRVCESAPETPIDAGYTYFGQFLDHNLTYDSTNAAEAWLHSPCDIKNKHKPRIDLGHLYGAGPRRNEPDLYVDDDVLLRTGSKVQSIVNPNASRPSFDVDIEGGKLVVADNRAGDNLAIRQMTAVFARLHNLAVEEYRPTAPSNEVLFNWARQKTTWLFQMLVVEDYLAEILDPIIYADLFGGGQPAVHWKKQFSIPVEFSAAAMRFGHSMVRDSYFLSEYSDDMPLREFMERGLDALPLPAEMEIDWGAFFQNAGTSTTITARPIDTRLSEGLRSVPLPTALLFNSPPPEFRSHGTVKLPVLTFWRGAGLALATGQRAAAKFGLRVLKADELTRDCEGNETCSGAMLKKHSMQNGTPLWYYVLKESEMPPSYGRKLGALGSRIVGETIFAALEKDANSYVNNAGTADSARVWTLPGGSTEIVDSLGTLFALSASF